MNNHFLLYLLYGFIAGFSEFTPVSASAHQALFPMLLRLDSAWPMLRFCVHSGALASVMLLYWQRVNHIYNELRLVSLPPRQRKRPPDTEAILDARLISIAAIPALIGAICSAFFSRGGTDLLWLAIFLTGGAVLVYVPDYVPGGDRKTGAMSPLEGVLLGICAGCSIIPGISRVGLMLALALLRKCSRSHILDLILLISGVMLAENILVDFVSILVSGFSGFTLLRLIGCLLAAMASFGGGIGAIFMMRFLSVKTGFSGFAFYGWGLGLVSFILYLMV